MRQLSSKEIEETTGITRRTIQGYVKAGWLPKPEFKSLGRYGASLYWVESTVNRLLTIKNLKKAGYKNKKIDKILKERNINHAQQKTVE